MVSSPPPPLWGGACGGALPRPALWFRCCGGLCTPTQLRLWLAVFAVVPAAGDAAHDVVLQTATRVDNRIIFDIMLNTIIVVVIFIISTIKEQLPPSPSPYNPHNQAVVVHVWCGKLLQHRFRFAPIRSRGRSAQQHGLGGYHWGGGGVVAPDPRAYIYIYMCVCVYPF